VKAELGLANVTVYKVARKRGVGPML